MTWPIRIEIILDLCRNKSKFSLMLFLSIYKNILFPEKKTLYPLNIEVW